MTEAGVLLVLLAAFATYTDIKNKIIFDAVPIALIVYYLLMNASGTPIVPVKQALAGMLIGWLLTYLLALKGLMGAGDVKFLGALGLWFGYRIVDVFLLAPIIGCLFAVYYLLRFRNTKAKIPFGPSIALAALIVWFSHKSVFVLFEPVSRFVFGLFGIR